MGNAPPGFTLEERRAHRSTVTQHVDLAALQTHALILKASNERTILCFAQGQL